MKILKNILPIQEIRFVMPPTTIRLPLLRMLETNADLAIVVGGYNSSNTSHLVELCEEKLPTYFINSEEKILSAKEILHYNFHTKEEMLTSNYLPATQPVKILLTSGASCPDALVEGVIRKLAGFYQMEKNIEPLIRRVFFVSNE